LAFDFPFTISATSSESHYAVRTGSLFDIYDEARIHFQMGKWDFAIRRSCAFPERPQRRLRRQAVSREGVQQETPKRFTLDGALVAYRLPHLSFS
jgi:hypothetical protein